MIKNAKQKRRIGLLAAAGFWLGVWQLTAMAVGQPVLLPTPGQALAELVRLLPAPELWQRAAFSAGRILLGFGLGAVCSTLLAAAAWALDSGGTAACAGDAAGKSHTGGQFYHFSACMGQRPELVGADQLFDGAAGAVWCGAHRDRQRGWAAGRDGAGVPSVLVAEDAGHLGCRRCCPLSGRGAAWRWVSAGRAALRPRSSAYRTAAWGMPCTGPRSPWLLGRCLPGRRSSCC